MEQVTIEEFSKIELRVGVVKSAEKIEGTRLIRLLVDIGKEVRQIVSGIGDHYSPEQLVNRNVVVVVNLKPKRIRGYERQGMILAAECKEEGREEGPPVLLTTLREVPAGSRVC